MHMLVEEGLGRKLGQSSSGEAEAAKRTAYRCKISGVARLFRVRLPPPPPPPQ